MIKIIDKQTATHYFWATNCNSWILSDTENLSIKQENMPSGTREKLHFHSHAQQFFFILNGTATFYTDAEKLIATAQKGVHISPNTKHYILLMKQTKHLNF